MQQKPSNTGAKTVKDFNQKLTTANIPNF